MKEYDGPAFQSSRGKNRYSSSSSNQPGKFTFEPAYRKTPKAFKPVKISPIARPSRDKEISKEHDEYRIPFLNQSGKQLFRDVYQKKDPRSTTTDIQKTAKTHYQPSFDIDRKFNEEFYNPHGQVDSDKGKAYYIKTERQIYQPSYQTDSNIEREEVLETESPDQESQESMLEEVNNNSEEIVGFQPTELPKPYRQVQSSDNPEQLKKLVQRIVKGKESFLLFDK